MKSFAALVCFVLVAAAAPRVHAADSGKAAIDGSYLLIQKNGYQRVLSFDSGGTVSLVSEQQPLRGFTSGEGAWKQTGPGKAVATVIDFNFNRKDGKPTGTSLIVYTLNFSEPVAGKYQKLVGASAGKAYAVGQNPLSPTEKPIRVFGTDFTGQRITVK